MIGGTVLPLPFMVMKHQCLEKVIRNTKAGIIITADSGGKNGSPVNVFGSEAVFYKFSYAGFLCDPV